jgi:hypothetical protein
MVKVFWDVTLCFWLSNTESHVRRRGSSTTPLWKPQTSHSPVCSQHYYISDIVSGLPVTLGSSFPYALRYFWHWRWISIHSYPNVCSNTRDHFKLLLPLSVVTCGHFLLLVLLRNQGLGKNSFLETAFSQLDKKFPIFYGNELCSWQPACH